MRSLPSFEKDDSKIFGIRREFLLTIKDAIPVFVLLLAILGFSLLVGPRFFSPLNMSLILQQVTVIGLLATAQTLVILTAGIDLSVGAMMLLSSVVMGRLSITYGVPVELSLIIGIAAGAACGYLNGIIVARLQLPAFIATLGTWSIFNAIVLLVSQSQTYRSQDVRTEASLLQWLGSSLNFGGFILTYSSILMIALAVGIWYLLNRTAFGRHIHATGDDIEAAELSGINTKRVLLGVYILAGALCGIAGWVLIGRIGAISPFGAQSSNLDAVSAVVIGGTSLFGGRGSIVGTMVGALIVGVFRNGLALAGVDILWQEFSVGSLIIIAVVMDQWMRRVTS